jgi:DnaJ-class molecular chaperone
MICPKCKGKGTVIEINWLLGLVSFGMSALMEASDPNQCPICWGTGQVKNVDLEESK